MEKKVLVALQIFGEYSDIPKRLLKEAGLEVVFNKSGHRLSQDEVIRMGRGCDGVIAGVEPYNKTVIDNLPGLKCISRCGVGSDSIDVEEAKSKGIAILYTPEAVIQPVAEITIAMIFALLRNLTAQTISIKAGQWKRNPGYLLAGKKVGVIGLGRIGRRVAEMLKILGAEIYGVDLNPDNAWAHANGITIFTLPELLKTVDIVTIHVSVMKEKCFFMGKDEISALKKGSFIINTSRGTVIDENALCESLLSGQVKGAGLDVFPEEPYHGPLTKFENVILTPHIATLTVESRTEMEIQAVRNLINYFGNTGQ